jgi:hypothetical protein
MNKMNGILIAIIVALSGLLIYQNRSARLDGVIGISTIDRLVEVSETTYTHIVDTIKYIDTKKTEVNVKYNRDAEHIASIRGDTSLLKKTFDSVYVISEPDSSTDVRYSQIEGALVVNSKFIRDSTKLFLTENQLSTCTTGVTQLRNINVMLADSSKSLIKVNYSKGFSDGSGNTIKYSIYSGVGGVIFGIIFGVIISGLTH